MFATKPDTSKRSTTKRKITPKRAAYAVAHVAKSLLSHLALVSLLLHQFISATAFAENLPITPDGSTNTQVTKTASGVDQVNIAAPNSSGLSHNKFTDYNINRSGQVINNFSGKNPAEVVAVSGTDPVTSTQIGGLVTANPNLANSGGASIILNEVTSTNNSQLLGYAEIAGTRAELIISNPNGITCSGCGFINTSRLSLIAGSSSLQNGNLEFNLKEQANPNLMIPLITVEGLGLDVERATHADIVASAIKLIATTYGSDATDVSLKVGEGGYNYSTKNIDQNSTSASTELFAIDASSLGAIQAGRIFIVATKDGFGVKLDASLTATKTLNIDTAGNLYYTSLNSGDQVNLKAKNIYSSNLDSAIAAAAIEVRASAEFKNLGRLTASKINISNSNIFNNLGVTEALNLDISGVSDVINSGTIFAQNSLGFSAENLTNKSSGIISSTAEYTLVVSNLLNNSGAIYSPTNLASNGGNIINSGSIIAEENLTLNLAGGLSNFGEVQSSGNFYLTAASLDNSSSIKSFAKSTINVAAISNNVNAVIFSQGDTEILQNNLLTNYGHILSAAKLSLDGKVVENSGEIYSVGDLDFSLTTSLNNSSSLSALSSLTLKGSSTITNSGKILSGGVFVITAASLTNSNQIQSANNLTANISADLTNNSGGFIYANNALTFNIKNNFTNNRTGVVKSLNALTIQGLTPNSKLNQFQNISASIESLQGDITIFAKEFFNKRATQDLEIITLIKTAANKTWYEDKFEVYDNSPGNNLYRPNQGDWGWVLFDFSQPNVPYRESYHYDIFAGDSWGNGIIKTVATRREAGSLNLDSVIKAGGMFTAYSDNFTNQNGQILAVGNVTINATNFNNKATAIYQTINDQCVAKNGGTCYRLKVNSNGTRTLIDTGGNGHIFSFEAISSFISANIKSASNLVINATNNINNGDNQGEVLKDSNLKATTTINPLSSYTPESAFISTIVKSVQDNGYLENIGDIAATIAAQSDLEKSTNPNAPVYESRSQFTDMSTFCSSSCLWARIKASQEAAQKASQESASKILDQISSQQNRFFGDAAADRKLIEKQLQQIYPTDSFQSYDSSNYINNLMNNSVSVATDLQLSPGITLTKEQIENLTKDIVWIEPINMPDGTVVLAPKVYLSKTSRNNILAQNARGGATLSAKNIVISGDLLQTSLTNYGSIIAGNNLSISNIDNLTQSKNSLLTAMNDLNLSINSNLLNYGTIATTGSASNLSLTSLDGSVTNKSNITSANDLNITVANDIKNIGAEISSVNNLSLKSLNGNILNTAVVQTNDANLLNSNSDSYKLRFGDTAESSGNIYSNLVQNASLKGGNIEINAAGNFANLAANITAKKALFEKEGGSVAPATETGDLSNPPLGNLSITTGNNITIDTLKLHNHSESSWGNGKKGGSSITDTITNIASNINSSGSVSLNSNNSINIAGSNLTASENITATAQNNINIQASQNTSYSESQNWKTGSTTAKISTNGSESLTNNIANLNANGDISLTSGNTTNLIGAKLTSNDVTITAGNEINIFSVANQNSSWSTSSESRNFSAITGIILGGSLIANTAPIPDYIGIDAKNSSLATGSSSEKTSNLAGIIEASGNVALTSNQDLTISGSNISGATGSLISNQGSVNIISAVDVEKTSSSSNSSDRASDTSGFEGSSKFSESSSEATTNIASNINFTDALEIKTLRNSEETDANINIKGSNITVSNGDLTLASAQNINIENAVDTTLSESSSKKKNETVKNISQQIDYAERAASASLNANNINIQSMGDVTIQGSNISTKENLIVGSFTIAQNSDGSYQKDSGGNYVTTANSTVDNLTIKNADLKEYHYSQSSKGYVGVAGVAMRMTPYVLVPIKIASSLVKNVAGNILPSPLENSFAKLNPVMLSLNNFDKLENKLSALKINSETETKTSKSTSYSSNINVGGSMMTNSVGNTLIQGSNLNINGDLLANSLGSFTIAASQNTESDISQTSFETAGKFHSDLNLGRLNYKAGVAKEFVSAGNESDTTTLVSSNLNIGGSALVNSSDEFALLASNFITQGSTEIIAKNNLNISDGKNTQSTSSYLDKLTIDVGVQVGNAYADAAYAVVDAVEAQRKVKEAYAKLNKIEALYEQDMASSKAVDRAKYQVVLALVNSGLSLAAAMQSISKAGTAASTSSGTGFYGSLYADITKLKSTTTAEYAQSIASNLTSGSNLALTSGTKDINITGSNISSENGDLILTAMLGNLNIKAGESTYSQSYKMNSQNLGGSFGTNGASANIGFNEATSSFDQTTYTNSQLSANNGTLSINSKQDANIIGANLLANDINLNIGGNLLLKSKQNLTESDSYSIGINLGISGNSSGVNGGSAGFNQGNGYSSRAWLDHLTSIIGTNSVTINTANNTNIVGALIANRDANGKDLGNLILNTKSLTFSDLKNFSNSESNSFGINLSAGSNPNNPTANGSLNLNLAMQGSESSSDSKATVGQGIININNSSATQDQTAGLNRDITQVEANKRDVITSDFDASLKIDLRLLAAVGNLAVGNTKGAAANWNSYVDEAARGYNIGKNVLKIPTQSLLQAATSEAFATSDAINSTSDGYKLMLNLAYKLSPDAKVFASDAQLVSYEGDNLEDGADAKGLSGFYDRQQNKLGINLSTNSSDSELAGTLAHEGLVHKQRSDLYNQTGNPMYLYNETEEISADLMKDFATTMWGDFQSGNTSLRASIPSVNREDNDYVSSVMAGSEVNPALRVKAQKVALGKSHLLIDHTPEPEEQKNYVNKDGYIQDKETGNWFKTWGAGPETSILTIVGLIIDKDLTNLKSDVNRAKDINPSIKIYQSPNLVPVEEEWKYVEILNQLDKNYQDNLKYNLFPSLSNSGYNSNSYVSGLLNAAKITPPLPSITKQYQWQDNEYPELPTIQIEYKLPLKLPGYDKPIPIKYFQGKQ